ncbi:ABC transporter ATP-binding protein [Paracoccaceae bacterium]|nr:ABC transporter ATP-binding protein [Paracoccaceae bacterium]MDB0012304.1 ABC transporter ATP-binding protein [Paracoccaceae bacterium]
MAKPVLKLRKVFFRWPGRSSFSLSLADLTVSYGEKLLLLGASGTGKSTLLSVISGTLLPDQGSVEIAKTEITKLSASARDRFRAEQLGVIFQQFNLLPFGSVADNILLPLRFAPIRRNRVKDAKSEVARLCAALGLPVDIGREKASSLSVGQQQRVAVARALIGHPPLIIADEPTSALDIKSQDAFLDLLFTQAQTQGTSVVLVSHDERLGPRFDRILHMEEIAEFKRGAA